jgi:hypothetical protein
MNTKRGRPKGYNPYTQISYEELADWVGRKTKVPVSKKWLQSLMGEDFKDTTDDIAVEESTPTEDVSPKIDFTIKQL